MKKTVFLLLIVFCCCCTNKPITERHQGKRDNVLHIQDRIKEIVIEDVFINDYSLPYIVNEFLIIMDFKTHDEQLHLFDKNSFQYITSCAPKGQGPGEIANIGYLAENEAERLFYLTDHGKNKIFSYNLDSIINNPYYQPEEKMVISQNQFPSEFQYINDTLCIGKIIEPTGDYGFHQSLAKWNMLTGEIRTMPYTHPGIEKKRSGFALSLEHGIYVEYYYNHDLMSLCTLDGELICNVYGRKWKNSSGSNKKSFYEKALFYGDKLIVTYMDGVDTFTEDKAKGIKSNTPTCFMIFDIEGSYLQTWETGYDILRFCYDKENHRIILTLDDEMQFAYLDLEGLI